MEMSNSSNNMNPEVLKGQEVSQISTEHEKHTKSSDDIDNQQEKMIIVKEDGRKEGNNNETVRREEKEINQKNNAKDGGNGKEDDKKEESASVKGDSGPEKEGSGPAKGESENAEDESEDEKEMGLLDRPVEVVSGSRSRKQVERLEYSLPTKDKQVPEGRGTKLGDCPRIDFQISKQSIFDLKPLHRILFNRQGGVQDTKRNIRKFSGFHYEENSREFEKNKSKMEKYSASILKKICEVLDLERSGTKEEIINRILKFLVCPSDSGKTLPKKRSFGRDKKSAVKKSKSKKSKASRSEEENNDEIAPSGEEASDISANEAETSDAEIKMKSKTKSKKTPLKNAVKRGKTKKEAKGLKRKKDITDSSGEDSKPAAKKSKLPDNEEIEKLVRTILEQADLHEITMKKVIKQVYDTYPSCDLTDKKAFIKQTIKTVLHLNDKGQSEDRKIVYTVGLHQVMEED